MAANRKLLAAAAACAAAVIGLTGCSSDDGDKDPFKGMSADKIAKKASEASKDAGSFRAKGEGKKDGKAIEIDFSVASSGDCKGTMGSDTEGRAQFLAVGKTTYVKGDDKFWKNTTGGAGAGELLKGRWMKSPKGDGGDSPCQSEDMFKSDKLKGMKREKDTEVDGKKAAVLTKKKGAETKTFYVAMEGKPYFLKAVTTGGDEPATMYFTDYGKTIEVKAPPADETVDPDKLGS
ncbi:hypothetical protein [Streptomyces sp. NPDC059063]|uniref:hypothetical protein n=1 Tax=unclassified Streptomyces TaxID=2593676 RepID=UPI003694BBA0